MKWEHVEFEMSAFRDGNRAKILSANIISMMYEEIKKRDIKEPFAFN